MTQTNRIPETGKSQADSPRWRCFACRCLPFGILATIGVIVYLSITGTITLFEKEPAMKSRLEQITPQPSAPNNPLHQKGFGVPMK